MKQPSHAQEDGALRSQRDKVRKKQVERVCDLQCGNEAKQQEVKVKSLGSLGRVKAPALHAERDLLFEKYLTAYDSYHRWNSGQVEVYCTNRQKYEFKPQRIDVILLRHLNEISEQLRTYDERINAATKTGTLSF